VIDQADVPSDTTEAPPLGPDTDLRIPAPLPEPPRPFLAVGKHGPASVDAEDFSRRLGNWGNASKLIGDRWEAISPSLLWKRLPWQAPLGGGHTVTIRALLALDSDPVIGRVLQRAGVSAPDLLLIGTMGARTVLRAGDCKVSLDTADREQTAPLRLQQMFARAASDHPEVGGALLTQLAMLPESEQETARAAVMAALQGEWSNVLVTEGLFVAPENGFNRWFLMQLDERRRTGAPLGRMPMSGPRRSGADVRGPVDAAQAARLQLPSHLESLSVHDFLASVPGWQEAELVASLDGVQLDDVDPSVAERCWRVGAGLRGAVLGLKRRLFHNALPVDGSELDTRAVLNQMVKRRGPRDSGALVGAIAQFVAGRRPLWERESALMRAPLSFAAWSAMIGDALRDVPAARRQQVIKDSASPRVAYRELTRLHAHRVVVDARELEVEEMEDTTVLQTLEERADSFHAASLQDAEELAAAHIAAAEGR